MVVRTASLKAFADESDETFLEQDASLANDISESMSRETWKLDGKGLLYEVLEQIAAQASQRYNGTTSRNGRIIIDDNMQAVSLRGSTTDIQGGLHQDNLQNETPPDS